MRTAVYIDGFNFYYGAVKDTAYKWLDLKLLCETILQPHHQVSTLKYFTAKVKPKPNDRGVSQRQATYFKAIKAHTPELSIIYGHFLETTISGRPPAAKHGSVIRVVRWEEKGSYVNVGYTS